MREIGVCGSYESRCYLETLIFLTIFFAAGFSYGIIAIVNPIWAWKHGFRTNPKKVREPNRADMLMTKVMGIFLIIIMIVILVTVLS